MSAPQTAMRRALRRARLGLVHVGCCGGVDHFVPRVPLVDVADIELHNALVWRREMAATCRCRCGGEYDPGDPNDPSAVPAFRHRDDCPASDDNLRRLLRDARRPA